MRLADSVALVTGASAGIGRAVAGLLADQGAQVLVHGRDRDRVETAARAIGGTPIVADLAIQEDRSRLAEEALAVRGRVDVLVNNAGLGWSGPFTQMSVEKLREVLEVDLVAQIELTHAILPGMVERRRGHICFVGSVAGRAGVAGESVYAAAKAGLDLFADSLRAEASDTGIGVGVIFPGVVRTGFFEARGRPYDRRWPRPVSPDAVARAVVRTVVDDRAETWSPSWLRVTPVVKALAPAGYRRLVQRFGEQVRLGADDRPAGGDGRGSVP